MKKLRIFLALVGLGLLIGVASAQTNPQTQITWPRVTGSGAPASTCPSTTNTTTTATLGTPYTDLTNSNQYTCMSTGWVKVNGGGSGPLAPYTGLVATRTAIFGGLNNTLTWIMGREYHTATENIPVGTLKVGYSNFTVNLGTTETALPGSTTYKVSVEYPLGTIYPCTFSSASTITLTGLGQAVTDACGPGIPYGSVFWIRTLVTNTAGIPVSNIGNSSAQLDAGTSGTGTPLDLVDSGSLTPYIGGAHASPAFLIGKTTRPSVCMAGDSRVVGINDTSGISGDVGELERSIGPMFAWTQVAQVGESLYTALSNYTQRLGIGQYCSHWIDEYGINDIFNGQSSAQIISNHTAFAALVGKPTFGTTIPPTTSSTDNFATTTNQTWSPTAAGSFTQWQTYNAAQRGAGAPGEVGAFDIAAAVSTTSGKWFANGTPNYYTSDGEHENAPAALLIQASDAINLSKICPTCGTILPLPQSTIAFGGAVGYPYANGTQMTTFSPTIPATNIGQGTLTNMTFVNPTFSGPVNGGLTTTNNLLGSMLGFTPSAPIYVGLDAGGASNGGGCIKLGSIYDGICVTTNGTSDQFDSFWSIVLAGNQFTNKPLPVTGHVNDPSVQVWAPGAGFSSTGDIVGFYNGDGTTKYGGVDNTGTVYSPIINATTGFRVGGAAPSGHCLLGNGTNYVDSSSCGSAGATVIQVNGTPTSTATPVNLQTSTANTVGLTLTPSNPSVGNVKYEVTGSSYTGNAATATLATTATNLPGGALGSVPYQLSSGSTSLVAGFTVAGTYNLCETPTGVSVAPTWCNSPITKAAVTSNFLTGYNATTGVFTATQPALSDIVAGLAPSGSGTYNFNNNTVSTDGLFSAYALGTATSGGNFNSAPFNWTASYWTGSAAAADTWACSNILGAGANPTSTLTCGHSGSSGTAVISVPNLTVTGTCTGCGSGSGISGATAGQALIAGSATTATSSKAVPSGGILGTTDTQTVTNKDLTGAGNTFPTFNQNTTGTAANLSGTPALPNGTTATTQTTSDTTTKLATDAFVGNSIAALTLANIAAGSAPASSGTYNFGNNAVTFKSLLEATATGTATSGANFNSGTYWAQGSYWNGSAAAADTWAWADALGTGANPTSLLSFTHTGSSGAATVSFPAINDAALVGGGTQCVQSDNSGNFTGTGSVCGPGTVTSFSAGALSPLFTTSVATSTTTPALTFALSNVAANRWLGNNTGSTAAPAYSAIGTNDWSPNAYITGAGSVNVMTATLTPAATALTAGLRVEVLPNLANTTTTPTLNVSGLGAKNITKNGTAALVANDYTTTAIADFEYDGTEWQLLNPQTTSAGGTPAYPLTITGGVSGGVVYGSSSTQLTVSPAGTVNTLMKWGGAGAAPAASSITDNGTSITTAEPLTLSGTNSLTLGASFTNTGIIKFYNSGSASVLNVLSGSQTGTFNLSFPVLTATDTIETLGLAQTITALKTFSAGINTTTIATATNCASSASPAVCGSAASGAFTIAAGATTITVNTSAVTANSEIEIQPDSSLGTRLSVTCNTTLASIIGPVVTARTAATSFTVTITGTLVTNPACYTYSITN